MKPARSRRQRAMEWIRRYLPNEVAGTAGELGGAAIWYFATGSLVAAAIAATVGAFVGYYAAAYIGGFRIIYQTRTDHGARRIAGTALFALRSVLVEFGPGELLDSVLVRPLAYYFGPLLVSNVWLGWIVAKIVADIAFYACTIASYERFNGLLAVRRPPAAERADDDEPVAPATAA